MNRPVRLSWFTRALSRHRRSADDEGVYAILYAILIVIMVAMAGFALDISAAREDRRADKSAADSAALAALQAIDPNSTTGVDPFAACQAAWKYLSSALDGVPDHSSTECSSFQFLDTTTLCADAPPYQAPVLVTTSAEDDYTIQMEWPVPRYETDGTTPNPFLQSDLAPKTSANDQQFSADADGTNAGCDRFGVAVAHHRTFGISNGIGIGGTTTLSHSVARVNPNGGPIETVAALNVLNPEDCPALRAGGKSGVNSILVGPVVGADGLPVVPNQPGTIAVESSGTHSCSGDNGYAIITNGSGTQICASSVLLSSGCDGKGVILSYALTAHGRASSGNITPDPIAEPSQHGWSPVTKIYGCVSLPLSPEVPTGSCVVAGKANYIKDLYTGLQTSTLSGNYAGYTDSQAPYTAPAQYNFTTGWSTPAWANSGGTCTVPAGAPVIVPAGKVFLNCTDLEIRGTLILQGGVVVLQGGITINNGACLMVNVPSSSCLPPGSTTGSGGSVTTTPPPYGDTIFYLRNTGCGSTTCGLNTTGNNVSLWMPQTFVFSAKSPTGAGTRLNMSGTPLASATDPTQLAFLWTAPGTGPTTAGRTPLEQRCYVAAAAMVSQDCLDSRFSRLMYWSEYKSLSSTQNTFNGQGALNYAGVLFTPRGYDNFTGGSSGSAAAAQFWADVLDVNGGGSLLMQPDARFSIKSPTSSLALIR